jgi:hypothetical protein
MKKKIVKLTENDLVRIIEKVVKENKESELEELLTLDLGDDFEDEDNEFDWDYQGDEWHTSDYDPRLAKMARGLRKSHDYLPDEYEFEDDMYISEIKKLKKRISVMEAKLRSRRRK